MAVVLLAALPRPATAAPATGPGAAVIVNGAEISKDDLSAEIARRQRAKFPDSHSLTEPQKAEIERESVDGLISRELLYRRPHAWDTRRAPGRWTRRSPTGRAGAAAVP